MEPWQRLGTYAAGLAIDSAGARGLVADMHLVVAAGGGERDTRARRGGGLGARLPAAGRGRAAAERAAGERAAADPVPGAALQPARRQHLHRPRRHRLLAHLHGRGGGGRGRGAASPRRGSRRGRGGIALVGGAYVAGRWDMLLIYALGGCSRRGGLGAGGGARRHDPGQRRRVPGAGNALPCGGARREWPRRTGRRRHRLRAADGARTRPAPPPRRWSGRMRALLRPGYAVVSGASGAAGPTEEEAGFLADLRDAGPGARRRCGTRRRRSAIRSRRRSRPTSPSAPSRWRRPRRRLPQVLVTGFGVWRGEALALLEPVREGRRA